MAQSTGNRVYENYDPPHDWAHDDTTKTLILMLPGFRGDQLKVQVTSNRVLKVRGERQMGENRWRRLSSQFPLDSDVDTHDIGAKFEGGLLFVKLRKINKPQEPTPPEVPEAEAPPPTQKPDQQKAPEEAASPPKQEEDKKAEAKADEIIAQKKQEQNDANGKNKMEAEANREAQEKKSPNGLGEEAKDISPKAQEKLENVGRLGQGEAKVDQRLPTRVLRLRSIQQYKEALVGLIVVVKKQSKLTNLVVSILVVLVLGLYVMNAIKSYSGGAEIEEL
ncbi:hypothetical protein L6164_029142 [Bauhinia variegata]|uniref:Uncharacterized protein n=1 Tax=Bauhinia variegata TaxID=167791 RepID=A0ACB9L8A4_BAUVA|nr:hypothetical protein L6164_029142 [Bauhinia variegata]